MKYNVGSLKEDGSLGLISIEGDGDVNLEEVDIDSFPESMRKKTLVDMKRDGIYE